MASLWVYPGQGTHFNGMLHDLCNDDVGQFYLSLSSEILGKSVLSLDSQKALESSQSVQICLLISGVVYSERFVNRYGRYPDYIAGLSLGAWTAAVVSGVLDFSDALNLVALRGELMQRAFPECYGMTVLVGVDKETVESWVEEEQSEGFSVYLANINSANQIVISGEEEGMQLVARKAISSGVAVKRLPVSVPSHCILFAKQAEMLQQASANIVFSDPCVPYLSGSTARLLSKGQEVAEDLVFNMCRRIDWEGAMRAAWERGCRLSIEFPPGSSLSGLIRRTWPTGKAVSLESTRQDSLCWMMREEQDMSQ